MRTQRVQSRNVSNFHFKIPNKATLRNSEVGLTLSLLNKKWCLSVCDLCVCVCVCSGRVNVKVKFSLEQATKTQSGSRVIALIFL